MIVNLCYVEDTERTQTEAVLVATASAQHAFTGLPLSPL